MAATAGLPADLLLAVCEALPFAELCAVDCVCREWRAVMTDHGWRQFALRLASPAERVRALREERSTPWRRLVISLRRRAAASPPWTSLLTLVLWASSTDEVGDSDDEAGFGVEEATHVLEPDPSSSYWSSAGSERDDDEEALLFEVAGRAQWLTHLRLAPFCARFQFLSPVYAPTAVRIWLGHAVDVDGDDVEEHEFVWTSQELPVAYSEDLQTFRLPEPLFHWGAAVLRVDLLGRQARQEFDDLYYTCIRFVGLRGASLERFEDEDEEEAQSGPSLWDACVVGRKAV